MEGSWRKVRRNGLMWEPPPAPGSALLHPVHCGPTHCRVLGASSYQIKLLPAVCRAASDVIIRCWMQFSDGRKGRWRARCGNLIIRRLPGATSGQGQPGAPTLVRFAAGITGNWVAGCAEVLVASPARLSHRKPCPPLTVCWQRDSFKRWLIGARGDRPLTD